MNKQNKIIKYIVMNQVLVCYVSSFIHKSLTQVLSTDKQQFLYTFDTSSELLHTSIRVIFLFFISKIFFINFKRMYMVASFNLIISTCLFLISQFYNLELTCCFSWLINRVCVGLISATRDYIMYREIYRINLNIPLIKVLKSFGNIFTLLSVIMLLNYYTNAVCLIFACIVNFIVSFITIVCLEKDHKILQSTNKENKNTNNIEIISIDYNKILLITLVLVLICSNLLSDQLIYYETGSNTGFKLKFIGQTVCGLIYSYVFKNNIYASISFGLIASFTYLTLLLKIHNMKILGFIVYGLIYTIKNVAYLTIPKYFTKYNQNYQVIAFIVEAFTVFISNLIFENIIIRYLGFSKTEGYTIYTVIGIINWLIVVYIIYRNRNINKDLNINIKEKNIK